MKGFAALGAAAVLGGCALYPRANVAPELFAVIPAADGHIGAIVLRHCNRDRVISSAYGAQRVLASGRVEAATLSEAEVKQIVGPKVVRTSLSERRAASTVPSDFTRCAP